MAALADLPGLAARISVELEKAGLFSRLGTAFAFDDLAWEAIEVEGVPVRLATPDTLHRMKRDTLRPIDRADAEALRRLFDLAD